MADKPERLYLGIGESAPIGQDQTNPKDLVGVTKVPVGLLPPVVDIFGSLAMRDGGYKYDPYNWRRKKVRISIYLDALKRHHLAILDGEWAARDSKIPHFGHIIACAGIILDAYYTGNLVDDRPEPGPAPLLLEELARILKVSGTGPLKEALVWDPVASTIRSEADAKA